MERLAEQQGRPVPDLAMLRMVQPRCCRPGARGDSAFTAPAVYLQELSSIIGGLLALAGLTAGYLASSPVPVLTGPWSCK